MNKRYLILVFILVVVLQDFCDAQTSLWRRKRKEFIFGAGATNFLGELGGADQIGTNGLKDFEWPCVRPDFTIGYRYRTTRQTAIKGTLIYARLAGDDKLTKEPFRENRNLNFRSPLIELSSQFEYTIVRERPGHIYNLKGVRGWRYIQVTSYLFVGAGVIYFNPRGELNGKWHSLRPLSTEGQGLVPTRRKYSPVQFVIPFGIGFKYALSNDWSLGIELGLRKTFTDYLDDVSKTYFDPNTLLQEKGQLAVDLANPCLGTLPSWEHITAAGQQRGDPKDKDSYMFAVISFYYKIPKGRFTLPKFK
jgi:hypothetical protein